MLFDLFATAPRLPLALAMQERLLPLLAAGDRCAIRTYAEAADPAVPLPQLAVLLVEDGSLREAREACWRICLKKPDCVLLAAGMTGVHSPLEDMLSVGATDLLYLPVSDSEFAMRIRRALGMQAAWAGAGDEPVDPRLQHVIAHSDALRQLLVRLPSLAACDAGVLILGETGTGKEVFAQALHDLSGRAGRCWVPINCAAIPIDLVEGELFGHERGAYTNANASRAGLIEEAEGGTLFLDDVDGLPLPAQAKLLRLLQEREYRRVGANAVRHADIRVIATSNRDLAHEAAQGRFRQDLYYRLNVLSFTLPPLRERREDIAALATHFTRRYARQLRKPVAGLAPQSLRQLTWHHWPGNVRELQHTIERAVVLADSPVLLPHHLALDGGADPAPPPATLREAKQQIVCRFEREYIQDVLARCDGNITRAAREAGKHRRAFFELMRKHGIKFDACPTRR
jgi:two-component system response regulator GlrR